MNRLISARRLPAESVLARSRQLESPHLPPRQQQGRVVVRAAAPAKQTPFISNAKLPVSVSWRRTVVASASKGNKGAPSVNAAAVVEAGQASPPPAHALGCAA